MPLNSNQKRKVEDWLAFKSITKCPLCGGTDLRVLDKVHGINYAEAGAALGAGLRAVVVNCFGCGLVLPFDAKQVGV